MSLRRPVWGLLAALGSAGALLAAAACGPDTARPPYSSELSEDAFAPTPGRDATAGDASDAEAINAPQCTGIARVVAITGQEGHFIQPKSAVYDESAFTIALETSDKLVPPRAVYIRVRQKDGGLQIDRSLDFGNADGGLAVGAYPDAGRYPFADPGLDLTGDGRGCNTVTGRFDIAEMTFTAEDAGADASVPSLASFAATFDHHCEGTKPVARGCVRWTR